MCIIGFFLQKGLHKSYSSLAFYDYVQKRIQQWKCVFEQEIQSKSSLSHSLLQRKIWEFMSFEMGVVTVVIADGRLIRKVLLRLNIYIDILLQLSFSRSSMKMKIPVTHLAMESDFLSEHTQIR